MAGYRVLVLAICLNASAVNCQEEARLHRVVRSPDFGECEEARGPSPPSPPYGIPPPPPPPPPPLIPPFGPPSPHPPPPTPPLGHPPPLPSPPPPPPYGPPQPSPIHRRELLLPSVYHTQNWSGVARGIEGDAQEVFSGAVASAESAAQSNAISLASSFAGVPVEPGVQSQGFDEGTNSFMHSGQYNSGSSQDFENSGSGLEAQSNAMVSSAFEGESAGTRGQTLVGSESTGDSFDRSQSYKNSYLSGNQGGGQFRQPASFPGGNSGAGQFEAQIGNVGNSGLEGQRQVGAAGSGFGSGGAEVPYLTEGSSQRALGLGLASQGLQVAERAPCSTCQKGSYALSNADSYNGNAVALSSGG